MRTERVSPMELVPGNRHRAITTEAVVRLMESIDRIGLQVPPTIRYAPDDDGEVLPFIVAGAHRVEACKRLGIEFIDVAVMEADDVEARLWEISENLHRADLTAVERAEHIEEWRRLTEEKEKGGNLPPSHPAERGVKKVARDLGVDPAEVRRAGKIASLPPETRQQARDERWTATRLLEQARPPRAPVMAAEPHNDLEAVEAQVKRLMAAWNAAGPEAREEFMRRVDVPVFDRTSAA